MASLLYRLGRFSARRAWLVIVAWVVILGLAGGAFALFGGTLGLRDGVAQIEAAAGLRGDWQFRRGGLRGGVRREAGA